MSLTDYYTQLQVARTATHAEMKAAYRRLAKLYHPDKNAGHTAEEKFKQIKEAYETLINPQRRAKYDAKLNRAVTFTAGTPVQKKKPEKKKYDFTEEQARQRQSYKQQYKKTYKASAENISPKTTPRQTELKYILISVPVAVALLLLIVRIYEKPKQNNLPAPVADTVYIKSEINTPESPYKGIFGATVADSNSLAVIKIINRSRFDAVVFLENDSHKTVRHHFIASNYQLLAENLPPGSYNLYYWLGRQFSYKRFLFDTIIGTFKETISVDSAKGSVCILSGQKDTFKISLENKNMADTFLLRKIFSLRK